MGDTAPKDKTRTTTTYVVLQFIPAEEQPPGGVDAWQEIGMFEGMNAPAALTQAAKKLSAQGIEDFTLVTVPERSWSPERFRLETPAPRLVRA